MKQYGKVNLNFETIEPSGFGETICKTLKIYADDSSLPIIYANLETKRHEQTYDGGESWGLVEVTTNHNYDVYIGKTVDEVVDLYKTNTSFDTVTWVETLTEIE